MFESLHLMLCRNLHDLEAKFQFGSSGVRAGVRVDTQAGRTGSGEFKLLKLLAVSPQQFLRQKRTPRQPKVSKRLLFSSVLSWPFASSFSRFSSPLFFLSLFSFFF